MSNANKLAATAQAMVAPGKGILAVDESTPTCSKRFAELGIESTAASRRDYRELMFRAPGLDRYVSGAILYDETLRQSSADGRPLVDVMNEVGILPGIKVDTGAKALANASGETVTEGLDGLRERLEEYHSIGARFTKWRAVIRIGKGMPSPRCLEANAHALARYAALAQEAGLVPIVEPEVLMDGGHDLEACRQATDGALRAVFQQLEAQGVSLQGMILKPNMVVPGTDCPEQPGTEVIAEATLATLRERVPETVPGIAFLSGGMSGQESCLHLNTMNQMSPLPWQLTFSFGRALQYPGLPTWGGKTDNIPTAQAALLHRTKMSSLARSGTWTVEAEDEAS